MSSTALQMPSYLSFDMRYANMSNSDDRIGIVLAHYARRGFQMHVFIFRDD
ncbi:MAG: hypothetical protein ACKO96_35070 [Flammeovirgaceae bacterium]